LVQHGDTIISTVRPNRRSFLFLKNPKENTVVSTGFAVLTPTPHVEPRYLYYWVSQPEFSDYLSSHAKGAAYPAVAPEDIGAAKIDLPPLPVQRRIAAILSAYDDLIENNLRRIQILEEMARATYREWFVEFRFPGHERVLRASSTMGPIPKGWRAVALSSLVSTQYGYTESTSWEQVGPKYLRGMDINKSSYVDWSEVPFCPIASEDRATYRLRQGDVVVIRMADPGKVGIVEQEVDAVFASYLIRIAPKDDRLSPYFLFHLLDSKPYQDYISGASTGTTRKSASAGVVVGFDFILPPKQLVAQFENEIASIRQFLNSLLQQNANLRCTRDLLLSRLLAGHSSAAEVSLIA
jgi:type I restriction enzyme S subunit